MDRRNFLKTLGALIASFTVWRRVDPAEGLFQVGQKQTIIEARFWEDHDLAG